MTTQEWLTCNSEAFWAEWFRTSPFVRKEAKFKKIRRAGDGG